MQPTVLSVASRAVVQACEALELDTKELLSRAGVERATVFDADARIPAHVADAIWREAYALSSDPHLALRAAQALPFGAYRVVDYVVANAPDVRTALVRIAHYFSLIDPRASLALEKNRFVFSSSLGPLPPPAQQYTLAAIRTRLGQNAGTPIALEAVEFTFPEPPDVEIYERIFACELRFAAPKAALVYAPETLGAPMAGADPVLEAVLVAHAEHLVGTLSEAGPAEGDEMVLRVEQVLARELEGGELSAAHVAELLQMSERTLQRRLHASGSSYAEVLTRVRQQRAIEYLQQDDLSLTDVAFLLGFSEQSAFSRAFKRWQGLSPSAWRMQFP